MRLLYILFSLLFVTSLSFGVEINGELKKALLEKLDAAPTGSGAIEGRVYYDTIEKKAKIHDGVGFSSLGGGGGGSSGINLLSDENHDFESGDTKWTESGTSTFTADDTTADVFLGTYSGLWDAGASGEYLTGTAVTIPNALNSGGVLCLLEFYYKGGDANIDFYAYDGTSAVEGSTDTLAASTEWIRAYSTFTCPSSGTLTLRLESGADSAAIYIDNVKIGTNDIISVPDNRWPSYDETDCTITLAAGGGTLSTVVSASFVPYQDTDDNWRMVFNLSVNLSSAARTGLTLDLSGIMFIAVSQTISWLGSGSSAGAIFAYANGATNDLIVTHASATTTSAYFSGDVALASKPTWATKPSPDMYLAGMPSGYELPTVSAYLSADQNGLTSSTATKVAFDTEDFDESGIYDSTTNYRIQPTKAGKYRINWLVAIQPDTANKVTVALTTLRKNGSDHKRGSYIQLTNLTDPIGYFSSGGSAIVEANGTTDYFEIWALVSTASGTWTIDGTNSTRTHLNVEALPTQEYWANAIVGFNEAKDGRAGLIEYKYEELDISSSGNFSAAQPVLRIARVGSVVTLTWPDLGHGSSASPSSAAGFIPAEYRPNDTVVVLSGFVSSARLVLPFITSAGVFGFNYRDFSGNTSAAITTSNGTISWVVDE